MEKWKVSYKWRYGEFNDYIEFKTENDARIDIKRAEKRWPYIEWILMHGDKLIEKTAKCLEE